MAISDIVLFGLQVSRQPGVTPEILQAEYNKFEQAYTKSTAAFGAAKWDRLNDFRNKAFAGLQQDVQRQVAQARQQELLAERQHAQQAQQQVQQASPVSRLVQRRHQPVTPAVLHLAMQQAGQINSGVLILVRQGLVDGLMLRGTAESADLLLHAMKCVIYKLAVPMHKKQTISRHVQAEAKALDLKQQLQRLQAEVDRLHNELNRERSSKEQHTSRVSTLEKQLQDKSSSLVSLSISTGLHQLQSSPAVNPMHSSGLSCQCRVNRQGTPCECCHLLVWAVFGFAL